MKIDYAKAVRSRDWLHHPVIGDPSFDPFKRFGPSPIYRSEPPYEWTVNGSLFRDPVTGHWYLYPGRYPYGYEIKKGNPSHAIIMRSTDAGKSWEHLGPVFDQEPFTLEGYDVPIANSPDVVVIYAEKRYWMAYDWSNAGRTWEHAYASTREFDAGAALAVADRPEGPFTRLSRPIFANSEMKGRLGRFSRIYATTLLRRKKDWIAFLLCDSGPYYAWGYTVSTAPAPEGPWSFPRLILSPENPGFYPAPVEFHPCFEAEGFVYAPATSVARNRTYQALFRAPLEEAHDPDAWILEHDGSMFHRERSESESDGIWGQTFHGFVHNGQLNVMFPSRDSRHFGTIQTAKAKWPLQMQDGFWLSDGTALLQAGYAKGQAFIEMEFCGKIRIFWDFRGVIGPDKVSFDASAQLQGLDENRMVLLESPTWTSKTLTLPIDSDCPECPGVPGIICEQGSLLYVKSFLVEGEPRATSVCWSVREGLLNAGQNVQDHWKMIETKQARCGILAVAENENTQVKWSFEGSGFDLWAPRGPSMGKVGVYLDGQKIQTADLWACDHKPSEIVFGTDLPRGLYAVTLQAEDAMMLTADCLTVRHSPS